MKFLYRISFVFLFIIIFYFLNSNTVLAQNTNYPSNQYNQYSTNTNSNLPKDLHVYSQSVVIEVLSAISCQLAGVDPLTEDGRCLAKNPKTGMIEYADTNGGAIGFMTKLIGMTYTMPISAHDYYADLGSNFGLAKKTYAVSTGIDEISPLLGLWKTFRNIVYLVFTLLFVIVGIGIMLKIPIGNKVTMSIQNQLPKIIIGLILVTFSYAIAGFFIDLMWVSIYLVINVVTTAGANSLHPESQTQIWKALNNVQSNNALVTFNNVIGITKLSWDASSSVTTIVGDILNIKSLFDIWLIGGFLRGLVGAVPFLIIALAIIIALFRLWYRLIMAYIFIMLDIVFAPFMIAMGVLPGSKSGFSSWARDLLAHLLAFPTVIVIFLLGKIFMEGFSTPNAARFVPPLIGNPNDISAFGALIGFGIILLAPEAVTMMRDVLKAPEFKYSKAIGSGIGAGQSALGSISGGVGKKLYSVDNQGNARGPLAILARRQGGRARQRLASVIRFATGAYGKNEPPTP